MKNKKIFTSNTAFVKKTRKMAKMSRVLFAEFLGVSVDEVINWETGYGPYTPFPVIARRFMEEIRIKVEMEGAIELLLPYIKSQKLYKHEDIKRELLGSD